MKQSHLALVKLLQKYGLLKVDLDPSGIETSELFPIGYLAQKGLLDEEKAISTLSEKLGIPVFEVNKSNSPHLMLIFDNSHISKVPIQRWQEIRAIPTEISDTSLTICMANPMDRESATSLEFDLGRKVLVTIGKEEHISAILGSKLNVTSSIDLSSLLEDSSSDSAPKRREETMESNVFLTDPGAAPVIKLVNRIFSQAIELAASDIHLSPEKEETSVRVRIDGIMRPLLSIPVNIQGAVTSRIKLLGGMDIAERRRPQDGRLRIKSGFGNRDLRISSIPTVHGENIVIRILASELKHVSFDLLGMPADVETRFKRALKCSSRVLLVTGPTGSGKTSTLYAGLQWIHDGTNNIITVEDPIEYRISGISQIQVNPKINLSFAEGLRAILRQDPDVVMVGEIRDGETASIAMQAAQTGHLVLSTLHTNTAAAAITRLKDIGVPPYIISSSLGFILAQRLVRRTCSACGGAKVGCTECKELGYKGRIGVFSFLEVTDAIRNAIRDEATERDLEDIGRKHGYKTLWEAAQEMVASRLTSQEEAERVLGPDELSDLVGGHDGALGRSGLQKRRVLLVEDDPNTRWIIAELLRSQLYEVDEAQNGIEGIERVYANPPEVIVCDLMMPKMNGIEMVQRLKSDSRTRNIPVLMLTAAGTEENELRSITTGAEDFVSKTTDSKIMLARVQRLLDRAHL